MLRRIVFHNNGFSDCDQGSHENVITIPVPQPTLIPDTKGYVRSILTSNLKNPDEFMAGVMFDSKESYDANSNDPDQGAWYKDLCSHLTADPEFDGKLEREFSA